MRFSNSNVQLPPLDCNGCAIGQRTQSDRTADGIQSGGGRNPIGWRTETDRVAGAFKGVHLSQVHQQSNIDTPLILLVQFLLAWCTSCSGKRQSRAETSAPPESTPEFTSRSSCHLRRRCPCQVLRHRCRDSDRRCCRCGCRGSCRLR